MMNYNLPSQISLEQIELTIPDLERSVNFYTKVIGLQLRSQNNRTATFGTEKVTLIKLSENPDAQRISGTTGLYHFAILVPGRLNLAQALERIIRNRVPVQGFADHGVSEAIYLSDPDGNGIEITHDRPRDQWPFLDGKLQMVTDPLDLDDLLSELRGHNSDPIKMPSETTIGHVHLHVRDIPESVHFYREILGFNLKQNYGPSAAFLAAGDYHHHVGVNTWAGAGVVPTPEESIGLRSFTVGLPTESDLKALKIHILKTDIQIEELNQGFSVYDPSGNHLKFNCVDERTP